MTKYSFKITLKAARVVSKRRWMLLSPSHRIDLKNKSYLKQSILHNQAHDKANENNQPKRSRDT